MTQHLKWQLDIWKAKKEKGISWKIMSPQIFYADCLTGQIDASLQSLEFLPILCMYSTVSQFLGYKIYIAESGWQYDREWKFAHVQHVSFTESGQM